MMDLYQTPHKFHELSKVTFIVQKYPYWINLLISVFVPKGLILIPERIILTRFWWLLLIGNSVRPIFFLQWNINICAELFLTPRIDNCSYLFTCTENLWTISFQRETSSLMKLSAGLFKDFNFDYPRAVLMLKFWLSRPFLFS